MNTNFFQRFFPIKKSNPFLLIIPLAIAAFLPFNFQKADVGVRVIPVAVSIGLYFLMRSTAVYDFIRGSSKTSRLFFVLIILYSGFAIVGHDLLLAQYPVQQVAGRLFFLILFDAWLVFPAIAFLYFTHTCKIRLSAKKQPADGNTVYSVKKLYAIFGGILLVWWLLYWIAFFPANMSSDSMDMWSQAVGYKALSDAHPVLYTVILRTLLTIWHSPAIMALAQVIFMAAIFSSFLVFLYKAGIPYKYLLMAVILIALIPGNGMMAVVIWKDVPFCCAMLWLTLGIIELVTDRYIFNYKTTLFFLTLSLTAVALLRHNGVMTAFFASVILLAWAIRNRRKGVVVAISSFVLVFFAFKKVVMPYWLKVPPVEAGFEYMAPVHGIASVINYNGTLSEETKQEMEKLLPMDVWKSHYTPYSADEYLYGTNTPFVSNLSKLTTPKVISMYANTFVHNPYLIVKDRLCGSEILWDVFQGDGVSNYSYQALIEENDFGFKQHDNVLKKIFTGILKFTGGALDPLVRRAGLFNILLMLLLLYMAEQRKIYWFIFLPLIGSNMSLLLSMTFQSFRYVYYVPLLFGFIWLLTISKTIVPAKKANE